MIVKTKFCYTKENLEAYFRFHLKRKDKIKWIYYGASLFFIITGLVLAFFYEKYLYGLIMLGAAIIMFLLFPYQVYKTAKKTASSRYKRDPQDIIFSENEISHLIGKQKQIYKWNQVIEVDETPLYIYFYISKESAVIVDKETVSEDEYNNLKAMIQAKKLKHYYYKRP